MNTEDDGVSVKMPTWVRQVLERAGDVVRSGLTQGARGGGVTWLCGFSPPEGAKGHAAARADDDERARAFVKWVESL